MDPYSECELRAEWQQEQYYERMLELHDKWLDYCDCNMCSTEDYPFEQYLKELEHEQDDLACFGRVG